MRLLIAREARTNLELGEQLEIDAPAAESFLDARVLADRLSALLPAEAPATGGEVLALARFEQALRKYLDLYLAERGSECFVRALEELDRHFGSEAVDAVLRAFEREFLPGDPAPEPAQPAQPAEPAEPAEPVDSAPVDSTANSARRRALLGEILILSIVRSNPAFTHLGVLYQSPLTNAPGYEPLVAALNALLAHEPALHSDASSLIDDLRGPIESSPDSVAGQFDWMLDNWGFVARDLEPGLLAAKDLIAEEQAPRFPPGPGPPETPTFDHLDEADVHYATDRSWMSDLVLVAKNTYVWLHQLSERYGWPIQRLDQIPDTELEVLAESGFTGLWLIGLWERSRASKRIKQLCGNPEAAGSAYSLLGYRIAADLGGDEALESLKRQAARFGIRLSADMVPNHTGIDSDWMMSHPDWFLSVPVCPFPSYTFDGPDLSSQPEVGIFLEDHYYDRTDAAVVFKRVDRRTGEIRFVYHGNDGTGTPWNDTAQLDYLNAELREAVTQTILDVAGKFPIIRFDAAMTLAKRHVQRLWYPEPGHAGAIPSRAEHTLSTKDFNASMPTEFWRSVVDRTERQSPDTLLMAEAFWLMEGYFVRNLGLHRVYNSSFMNQLRDGDNAAYRKLVQESLELDPELLKRSVNFLSNPDERSAIEQFGDGDRYFGACVLLATMPGLPMFAHGQVDGLAERYGMEYRRAYVNEAQNQEVIERHEREIFPLLKDRRRFTNVESFRTHDFVLASGRVDDNVIAYSSRKGDQTLAVVFNNHSQPIRGSLSGLNLMLNPGGSSDDGYFVFRDRLSDRLFLRPSSATSQKGLEFDLAAYESLVLGDFRELAATGDTNGEDTERLNRYLGLSGAVSLEAAQREAIRADARSAFGDVLATLSVAAPMSAPAVLAVENQLEELDLLLRRVSESAPNDGLTDTHEMDAPAHLNTRLAEWLEAISRLAAIEQALSWPRTERMLGALERLLIGVERQAEARFVLPAFALLGCIQQRWGSQALAELEPGATARRVLAQRAVSEERAGVLPALIELASVERWLEAATPPGREEASALLATARTSDNGAAVLGYEQGTDSVAPESFDRFLAWRATAAALSWLAAPSGRPEESSADAVVGWCDALERLRTAVTESDLRLEPVLTRLRGEEA